MQATGMPIHPDTASRAPALHRTITRLLKAGAIISPLRSNEEAPMCSVRLQHQPGAALHTADQVAQQEAADLTVARAVQVVPAHPTVVRAHQVAVQADLLAVVQEAPVAQAAQ